MLNTRQIENLKEAIRTKRARIEEINVICAQPPRKGVTEGSRRRLVEKRLHLELAVSEHERELHWLQFQDAEMVFRLEHINQQLLSAKTNDLAEEISRRISEGRRRIEFETAQSGNSAGFASRWLDFEEQMAEERVQRLYAAYCETWVQQNRSVTPAFIRAVRDQAIAQTLAAVKSSVIGGLQMRAQRMSQPINSAAIGEWSRRMDRLANRWYRKLEAEAIAAQYRAARPVQGPENKPPRVASAEEQTALLSSKVWHDLHETFRALAEEESKSEPPNLHNRYLHAQASFEDKTLESGWWQLGGGASESIRVRFCAVATRAGMTLRPSVTGKRFEVWLHHVFLDLLEHKSELLFAGKIDLGGIIERVCEASAISCARLERNALESEIVEQREGGVEIRPVLQPLLGSGNRKSGRKSTRPRDFVTYAGTLWLEAKSRNGEISAKVRHLTEIASQLDDRRYIPPASYLEASYARELRAFNSKNSRSDVGPIQTWTRLVAVGDKDHLRGMRRLLSRCAQTIS